MTTLAEITKGLAALSTLGDKQDETTSAIKSLTEKFSAQAEASELAGLKGLNAKKAGIASGATASVEPVAKPAKAKGGGLRGGALAGAGLGLAALGGALLKSAGGIAALGVAIPMFFGGLMIGSKAMDVAVDVMGASYNMEGLKKAALGFAGIVEEMPKSAMLALAGLMGISIVGGQKGALGLSFMGMAITGFLGGLLLGNTLLEKGGDMIGADFDFKATGKALKGFSGMIMNLSKESAIALGGILGLSVLASMTRVNKTKLFTGALGLGAAIMGILGGLAVGDALLDAGERKGLLSLDFSSTSKMFKGFSDSIGNLSKDAVIALVGILGVGGLFSKLKGKTKLGIVTAMTAIGAGISGLMIGLTAGDAAMEWIQNTAGGDGSALAGSFQMFNDSVGALNNENAIKAMIGILGAGAGIGTIVGAIGGAGMAAKAGFGIFAIMTGIGAGIAGLMIGLMAAELGISWMQQFKGQGDGISGIFKTFNDSIIAITPEALDRLKKISDIGALNIAGAMTGLSAGIVALLGAEGLTNTVSKISNAVWTGFDNIFGTSMAEKKSPGIVQQMVDGLEPLKDFDISTIDQFTTAINKLKDSMAAMGAIEVRRGGSSMFGGGGMKRMVQDIAGFMGVIKPMLEGGTIDPRTGVAGSMQWLFGNDKDVIRFPDGGLLGMDMSQVGEMGDAIAKLKRAMSGNSIINPDGAGDTSMSSESMGHFETTIVKFAPEALSALTEAIMQSDFQAQTASAAPIVVTQPNPNTQNGNGSGDTVVLTSKPAAVDPKVHSPADAAALLGY
jgi:hypothetical protein